MTDVAKTKAVAGNGASPFDKTVSDLFSMCLIKFCYHALNQIATHFLLSVD